jgi:transcriptional regulator with XRE-family HTH domain
MEWDPANIRALRAALRLPQEKFAYQLGAAPKTVRNWERGQHPPSLALQRALDQVWESTSSEQKKRFYAFLSPDEKAEAWTAADTEDGEESTSTMDSPVALVGMWASRPPAPAVTLDDLRRIAAALQDSHRYMDLEVVEYFRRRIATCAASDGASGPKEALPAVLGIVGAVESDSRHVKPSVRSQLLAVGAQGAEFVAWLYRDLGMSEMADHWRDRAIDWAQEAGDLPLQGYVLLKKAQAAWDDRDAPRMLALARAVQEGPWQAPVRVRAEAVQQEARCHAMLSGDLEMMERKLDEAQDLLAESAAHDDREGGSQLGAHYGPALLAMQIAICYWEAGRPGRAVEIFRDQLTREAFSRRDYGYFTSLMASALAAAGEPGEACRVGIDALGIALATNSTRTTREIARVAGRLQPWRHHPPVRDLYDALAASGVAISSS